eukprot:1158748-Pelagomonas_calceolata.AAC.17
MAALIFFGAWLLSCLVAHSCIDVVWCMAALVPFGAWLPWCLSVHGCFGCLMAHGGTDTLLLRSLEPGVTANHISNGNKQPTTLENVACLT